MVRLEDIQKNALLEGVEPRQVVRIIATEPAGADGITVYYKTTEGKTSERMLFRGDEPNLSIATANRPWSFEAPGEELKLGIEAYRINLAYLFDPMMAVHTSDITPLPHQITAVYESMLPRQPLRYVLADDPGAGKTIMAGLFIRELLMRADAQRILIVAPGSLVEQWQDELGDKFGLDFTVFSREMVEQSRSGNPFEDCDQLIARVDQLSRNPELCEKLEQTRWDLVVVDEAHKLSANRYGNKLNKTKRFELGELLGRITRHYLLMTATPHNGKEEDFLLFMSLLDADRFYGRFREGTDKVDYSDLMRRMVKEDMRRFDGTKLFPERRAYTVSYLLSDEEAALYEAVTEYVKEQMGRADKLDGKRKGTVGFALTILQRRLASSPEAIHQSIVRRHAKLLRRIEEEERKGESGDFLSERGSEIAYERDMDSVWDADDALSADDYEEFQEEIVDQATAARTLRELQTEVDTLARLEAQARAIAKSGRDKKWEQLSALLQDTTEMKDADGRRRKLIIFTEHRDTLNYLAERIRGLDGDPESVQVIHGGMKREDRRNTQEAFRTDPMVRVLIATDAAGEGVNLQNANLMINYDLPWNPNRIEQRFGRIHRIGQTEVCHLWNMVASGTREGAVFQRLFEKLETERIALGGRVFDILGEVFEERSLRELLIEAIQYGESPEVRARLLEKIDNTLEREHFREVLARNALCEEIMDESRLAATREELEKAEARKLQPYFIRSFFAKAFERYGGELRLREAERYEIRNVPAILRERSRRLTRRNGCAVQRNYERVCFDKSGVRLEGKAGAPMASLLHPGHPLMHTLTDMVLEDTRALLKQGAVLVDPSDWGVTPHMLFMIDHVVKEGGSSERMVSRRMQFVTIDPSGQATNSGWAPHLDLSTIGDVDRALVTDVVNAPWLDGGLESLALIHASTHLVPEHFAEVRDRRVAMVEKTLQAVHDRLTKEIDFWQNRYLRLKEDVAVGKQVRLNVDNVRQTITELDARLVERKRELEAMRHVVSATPVVLGGALVIPAGLLAQRKGEPGWTADAAARRRVELAAMKAVMEAERTLGHAVFDVSAEKCGWDITALPPAVDGATPPPRHIEVKGRAKGADTVTVTRNEIMYGLNQQDKFWLALVEVEGDSAGEPRYIAKPFTEEPHWAVASINLDLKSLLERSLPANATKGGI